MLKVAEDAEIWDGQIFTSTILLLQHDPSTLGRWTGICRGRIPPEEMGQEPWGEVFWHLPSQAMDMDWTDGSQGDGYPAPPGTRKRERESLGEWP